MNHYYTNNTDLKSEKTTIYFDYHQHRIAYMSDHGVFSKDQIDYGSRVLLDSVVVDKEKKTLLDVGCGYGTLGIALKTLYPWLSVEMVDVNERAVSLASESIQLNRLDNIKAYHSDIYGNVEDCFDVIVSNPPIRAGKKVVFEILEKAYDYLNDGGELYVVVQKKQGAPSAKKKMEDVFGQCEIVKRDKGYYILRSIKC